MIRRARPPVVFLGTLSQQPVGGPVWMYLHYLVGLRRLGFEPYYVEAHGATPCDFFSSRTDDGFAKAAAPRETLQLAEDLFTLGKACAIHRITLCCRSHVRTCSASCRRLLPDR